MRRQNKTEKLLSILDALAEDIGVFLSPKELRKIVYKHWDQRSNLSQALGNLTRSGYLEIIEKDNKKAIQLTSRGKLKIWRPRTYDESDGRWRLVAFDIEEERKSTRNKFRDYLKMMGFKPMQKSLWISPHDVSSDLEEIISMLDIRGNVDYFIADALTNKDKFEKLFAMYE